VGLFVSGYSHFHHWHQTLLMPHGGPPTEQEIDFTPFISFCYHPNLGVLCPLTDSLFLKDSRFTVRQQVVALSELAVVLMSDKVHSALFLCLSAYAL
jgi:hypothetical protein